jgi:Domain of unknown function (DUF5615)
MGVDVRVVEWLRRLGHEAVHLREQGLHRAPDEQVFMKAWPRIGSSSRSISTSATSRCSRVNPLPG